MKRCEFCGKFYKPKLYQETNQKYCNRSCKDKARYHAEKKKNKYFYRRGGYPRTTIIRLWCIAQNGDKEPKIKCHYCGILISPEEMNIDHKTPRRLLKTREEVLLIDNLVCCCKSCNQKKGDLTYEEFVNE